MDQATRQTADVRYFKNPEDLSFAAFKFLNLRIEDLLRRRGLLTMVLSGGESPRGLYRRFAEPGMGRDLPWQRIHLFWGDERCVPPDDPRSNYKLARDEFISKISIPPENVHRICGERETARQAGDYYDMILHEYYSCRVDYVFPIIYHEPTSCLPMFDIVLLGVGADGHTASLFPGSPALEETEKWAVEVPAPDMEPRVPRVTMTLPIFNASSLVVFIVTGPGKREIVRSILDNPGFAATRYPAAMIRPQGETVWFLDEAYK